MRTLRYNGCFQNVRSQVERLHSCNRVGVIIRFASTTTNQDTTAVRSRTEERIQSSINQNETKHLPYRLEYNRDTGIVSDGVSQSQLFHSVIGIEIHAQLMVPTKLFSSAPTKHHPMFSSTKEGIELNSDETSNQSAGRILSTADTVGSSRDSVLAPNTVVAPFDIGYPGTLPLLSHSAVQAAVRTAHALECSISPISRFERKHYHYADLPLGYQVTQQRWPIARNGTLQCRRWRIKPNQMVTAKQVSTKNSQQSHDQNRDNVRRRGKKVSQQVDHDEMKGDEATYNSATICSIDSNQSKYFTVEIDRIQLEQDTGKTTVCSQPFPLSSSSSSSTHSFLDFNRAGTALVEIVFRPKISSAYEAASIVSTLQNLLRFIGTCDGKMESGSLRCDLNISIAPMHGCHSLLNQYHTIDQGFGTQVEMNIDSNSLYQKYLPPLTGHRVEVKNLNSIRQVIFASEYEALRQASIRIDGGATNRETRTWDTKYNRTVKIRDKGDAVDYRFMPEPDLPPLVLNEHILNGMDLQTFLSVSIPELPDKAKQRLITHHALPEEIAVLISSDRKSLRFFEETVAVVRSIICKRGDDGFSDKHSFPHQSETLDDKKLSNVVANWVCNDLYALMKETSDKVGESTDLQDQSLHYEEHISLDYSRVDSYRLGSLVSMILKGDVSTTQAKKILSIMYKEDLVSGPCEIAESRGFKLVSSLEEIERICRSVISDGENRGQLEQYKLGGKHVRKIKKFFIGKIMLKSDGKLHAELVQKNVDIILMELFPDVVT